VVAVVCALLIASATRAGELGIDGTHFTLDGQRVFLLGVSYYGGCARSPELMARDFADLRERGVNWVRVWATWDMYDAQPAVGEDGAAQEPAISHLRELVRLASDRGLVVDVTLHRGGVLTTHVAHVAAVRTLARELLPWRNVYIDVANERDVRDARYVSTQECRELRDAIREVDSRRLVTASSYLGSAEELRDFLTVTRLDFITPHLPRGAADPARTHGRVARYLRWMNEMGQTVPVHLQEPFRRDYGAWQPQPDDFLTDLRGGVAGGAAGWCLHNGSRREAADHEPRRCFDLRPERGPFFHTLDSAERTVLAAMGTIGRIP
jgi:hypothetical protein